MRGALGEPRAQSWQQRQCFVDIACIACESAASANVVDPAPLPIVRLRPWALDFDLAVDTASEHERNIELALRAYANEALAILEHARLRAITDPNAGIVPQRLQDIREDFPL